MDELPRLIEELLQQFAFWAAEVPLETVLAVGSAAMFAIGVLLLLVRRRRSAAPELPAIPVPEAPEIRDAPRVAAAPVEAPAAELVPVEPPPAPAEPAAAAPVPLERPAPVEPVPVPVEPAPVPVEPVPVPAEPAPAAVEPPPVRLRERLRRTSETLVGRITQLVGGRKVDADLLDELEMLLFSADLGVKTAEGLLEQVRREAAGADVEAVRNVLHDAILERLRRVEPGARLETTGAPHVVLVLGVNGSGKTTTIGKLAARYQAAGKDVILGAGDTFRAAAIEQLQVWGERVGCDVIAGRSGGDPSAVAFDTVRAARARGVDVALIDTAGRLQTKRPLMEELGKMVRVIGRELEGAPHETLLVLDANTGQNAISQARLFTEVAGVTGLVLTKLDGTAKGGVMVGLADEFGIPVEYVGVGERVEDLRDFSAEEFVEALFAN
jgi:fused signal recognition particle receptor